MGFTSLKLGDLELKGEQKAALNAIASNRIASLSNISLTGFFVHFVVDHLIVYKKSGILFLLFIFDSRS